MLVSPERLGRFDADSGRANFAAEQLAAFRRMIGLVAGFGSVLALFGIGGLLADLPGSFPERLSRALDALAGTTMSAAVGADERLFALPTTLR